MVHPLSERGGLMGPREGVRPTDRGGRGVTVDLSLMSHFRKTSFLRDDQESWSETLSNVES